MRLEYKPKWVKLYKSQAIKEDMLRLTSEYYFGGNTVPFTAAQVVDFLRSKYR